MASTYLEFVTDDRGDTVDILYWHGHCAPVEVRALGSWPAPEAIDYPVYCSGCGERMESVPLTSWGKAEYEIAADGSSPDLRKADTEAITKLNALRQ
jgi:hypothetical protein